LIHFYKRADFKIALFVSLYTSGRMSYKVEVSAEELETLFGGTLAEWGRLDPDVHLVSSEGYRVFSHRVLLSLYSSQLQRILNDPVLLFSPQPASISVPASASSISTLLKMLTSGKVETHNKEDIKETADALGINIKNYIVENKRSSTSGLTVIKMPVKKTENKVKSSKAALNNAKLSEDKSVSASPKAKLKKWNTSVVQKTTGLKIELKEFVDDEATSEPASSKVVKNKKKETEGTAAIIVRKETVETVKSAESEEPIDDKYKVDITKPGPAPCTMCNKVFDTYVNLQRHIDNKHLPNKSRTSSKNNVKSKTKENNSFRCEECGKIFAYKKGLQKHKLTHVRNSSKSQGDPLGDAENINIGCKPDTSVSSSKSYSNADELDMTAETEVDMDSSNIILETEEVPAVDDCGYCGEKFDHEDDLNEHIVSMHG